MNNHVKEYLPATGLLPFVEIYWEGDFNRNSSRMLSLQMIPSGCLELIIHLNDHHCDLESKTGWGQSPNEMILGLFTSPYEVRFQKQVHVFAIRFRPEGIYHLFGVPGSELLDRYEDIDVVLNKDFSYISNKIREQINTRAMIQVIEKYLWKQLLVHNIQPNYVNFAADMIRRNKGIKINEIASRLSISKRQLAREFKEKLGVTPKHYLRIIRINEVLQVLNSGTSMSLTHVAYHCGYYDQSHFINDFKSLTGAKPSIVIKESDRYMSKPTFSTPF